MHILLYLLSIIYITCLVRVKCILPLSFPEVFNFQVHILPQEISGHQIQIENILLVKGLIDNSSPRAVTGPSYHKRNEIRHAIIRHLQQTYESVSLRSVGRRIKLLINLHEKKVLSYPSSLHGTL